MIFDKFVTFILFYNEIIQNTIRNLKVKKGSLIIILIIRLLNTRIKVFYKGYYNLRKEMFLVRIIQSNSLKNTIIKNMNDDIYVIDKEDILFMFRDKKNGTRDKFKLFK